jgi:hypothetical protein
LALSLLVAKMGCMIPGKRTLHDRKQRIQLMPLAAELVSPAGLLQKLGQKTLGESVYHELESLTSPSEPASP